jgi:hypothetical protein
VFRQRTRAQILADEVQRLRSTPERAEQPAGGLPPLYIWHNETDGEYERSPEAEAVIAAFQNADEKDWRWLFAHLGHSGHGKFWTAVLTEAHVRLAALDRKTGGEHG